MNRRGNASCKGLGLCLPRCVGCLLGMLLAFWSKSNTNIRHVVVCRFEVVATILTGVAVSKMQIYCSSHISTSWFGKSARHVANTKGSRSSSQRVAFLKATRHTDRSDYIVGPEGLLVAQIHTHNWNIVFDPYALPTRPKWQNGQN